QGPCRLGRGCRRGRDRTGLGRYPGDKGVAAVLAGDPLAGVLGAHPQRALTVGTGEVDVALHWRYSFVRFAWSVAAIRIDLSSANSRPGSATALALPLNEGQEGSVHQRYQQCLSVETTFRRCSTPAACAKGEPA